MQENAEECTNFGVKFAKKHRLRLKNRSFPFVVNAVFERKICHVVFHAYMFRLCFYYVSMGYTHRRHIMPFQGFESYFSALKGLITLSRGEVLWLRRRTMLIAGIFRPFSVIQISQA
jgi:hypothetical protein